MTRFVFRNGLSICAVAFCSIQVFAQPSPSTVRFVQGTIHGLLEMRAPDGHVVASGDIIQSVRGEHVTLHTLFNFKDGSTDDETTIFTQHRSFQFISDHHVQKGPFFPHPMDTFIDGRNGQVTTHTTDKDGKDEAKNSHVDLPPDIANGMIPLVIENMAYDDSTKNISMIVATPKPLVAKLIITKTDEDHYSLGGESRKATHYEIKIQLTGLAGVVAPIVGKTPPDIQIWTTTGSVPVFIREQGPIYPDSPIMTIQLTSPDWPDASKSGK